MPELDFDSEETKHFMTAFLTHYSSEFYDPKKAHEYYLRTRKLKGRNSTAGFSKKQKEGYAYAKNQIAKKTKQDLKLATDARNKNIAEARAKAKALRSMVHAKFLTLDKKLAGPKMKEERARITAELHNLLDKYRAEYMARTKTVKTAKTTAINKEYKNIKRKVR